MSETIEETVEQPATRRARRLLFVGVFTSYAGDSISFLVFPLMIDQGPARLAAFGLFGVLRGIAPILLQRWLIRLVSRFGARQVMIAAEIGKAVLLATMSVALWAGGNPTVVILTGAFTLGVLRALFVPALFTVLPQVLPGPALAKFTGPSLMFGEVGYLSCLAVLSFIPEPSVLLLLLDALSYLVSGLILAAVFRSDGHDRAIEEDPSPPKRPWRIILGQPRTVRVAILGMFAASFLNSYYSVWLPIHTFALEHGGRIALTRTELACSIGVILGGLVLGRFHSKRPGAIALVFAVSAALLVELSAVGGRLIPLAIGGFLLGIGITALDTFAKNAFYQVKRSERDMTSIFASLQSAEAGALVTIGLVLPLVVSASEVAAAVGALVLGLAAFVVFPNLSIGSRGAVTSPNNDSAPNAEKDTV